MTTELLNAIAHSYPLAVFVLIAASTALILLTIAAVVFVSVSHKDPERRRSARRTLKIVAAMIDSIFR
ncbi:hypothetical protein [Rhodococcus sp. 077-4]|uniref:hypothetical protein n=1 Tax=Rhodococcus sp. 077-4 TaxID=2789271 RepID=UPI0039F4626F